MNLRLAFRLELVKQSNIDWVFVIVAEMILCMKFGRFMCMSL